MVHKIPTEIPINPIPKKKIPTDGNINNRNIPNIIEITPTK